ncbi:F-box only protein 9-like [Uloborus diversus]|uniref:F-box only protein 9-like n=1 Tax=Uloborus diversus TaxID=327109 RepID=UPI0024091446|nr:F-box only protein 9-like [Uloborus diversus]
MDNSNCNSSTSMSSNRAGNPADVGGSSEDVDDAQDEESSSSSNVETELENFRLLWKKEIESSPFKGKFKSKMRAVTCSTDTVAENVEQEARWLFLHGVQAERMGKLQDAISFYRRAIQLVPDIEFRIEENSLEYTDFSDESDESSAYDGNSSESEDEVDNLVCKFQMLASKSSNFSSCLPKHEQMASHFSDLPFEIFMYILRWVVGQDLDVFSLEQISRVCRGFYVCARDPEIWKSICLRIWDVNVDTPNKYGSWRDMFIQRPHLSFNGVYISKTTYVRYGESSFQDANYRPCYLVEYYRYLRFFPDGVILMLTTPDDPYQSLYKLRQQKSKYPNVMYGRYKLVGSTVMAVVKKPKSDTGSAQIPNYRYRRQRQANISETEDQTFHLELEVKNYKKRLNCQLNWNRYSIHIIYRNGQEAVSNFDLLPTNFPCFWFSRVKSFTIESESPLK